MTDEQKKDKIYDILNDMEESELVSINNSYNSYTGLGCHIYEMEEFDDEYDNNTPLEIAEAVTGGSFSTGDKYFAKDDWDDCNSFDCIGDYVDCSDIAQYCVEHDEDFGNEEIRAILDKNDDFVIAIFTGEDREDMSFDEFIQAGYEHHIFDHDGEIMLGSELINRITDGDFGDYAEIRVSMIFIGDELERRGFNKELTVCKHKGVLFGDNTCFEDGRFYQWWYSDESDILLKIFFSNLNTDSPLYFAEVVHSPISVAKLVMCYKAE